MHEKNKKKIVKRSIDIESEFIGVPVEPARKKARFKMCKNWVTEGDQELAHI